MTLNTGIALLAVLLVTGCAGDAAPPPAEERSTSAVQGTSVTGTPDSTGMAGMDHVGMAGMQGDSLAGAGEGMTGMDHAGMPGMSGPDAMGGAGAMDHGNMPGMSARGASAGTPEVDHAEMAGIVGHAPSSDARGGTPTVGASRMADLQGMDHSQMQAAPSDLGRTSASNGRAAMDHGTMETGAQTRAMPGMDHAAMSARPDDAGSVLNADPGMEKLRALVAELVRDPTVRAQIEADTALRRRWADEGVRRVLLNP